MSTEKRVPQPRRTFTIVPVSAVSGAHLRRLPSGGIVTRTGLTRLNANSTLNLARLAHDKGLDSAQFSVTLGVNLEGELIAIYPVATGTVGATPVRIRKDKVGMTIHLSGVFESHPSLRVDGRRQCAVIEDTDAAGVRCLVLSLQSALAKPRYPRTKPKEEPTSTGTTTAKG